MAVSSLAVAVEAVFGLLGRASGRLLLMPLSLLKEELDLDALWLLEKLLLDESRRLLNILTAVDESWRETIDESGTRADTNIRKRKEKKIQDGQQAQKANPVCCRSTIFSLLMIESTSPRENLPGTSRRHN